MKYLFSYCCNYKNTVNELPDCELDGIRLCDKLSKEYNYIVEKHTQGSPQILIDYINNLNKSVKSTDTVIIQYSGHGTQVNSNLEKDSNIECLVFYDKNRFILFKDKDFNNLISTVKCKVIVIFDSCFSGGFNMLLSENKIIRSSTIKGELFQVNQIESLNNKSCFLMSSSENETSESTGDGGLFTNSILESTKNKNKTINQVYKDSLKFCLNHQTPKILLKNIKSNSKIF